MTTVTTGRGSTSLASSRFTATLASEWTKLWTLRFTHAMVLLALLLTAGATAVFLLTTGVTRGQSLAEMRPFEAAGTSLLGVDFAVIVLEVLCASAVASEYATGTIRLTLSATPRRWKVLVAKAVVLAVTALLAGILVTLASFGVGQLVLVAQGSPAMSLDEPGLLRLVSGTMLMAPFYSLLAASLAFVTRNAGGAIAAVLAIMSVPALVGALPEWWQRILLPYLPASALHSLSGAASPDALEYLAPGLAVAVLVAWATVLLLAAYYAAFARRDA